MQQERSSSAQTCPQCGSANGAHDARCFVREQQRLAAQFERAIRYLKQPVRGVDIAEAIERQFLASGGRIAYPQTTSIVAVPSRRPDTPHARSAYLAPTEPPTERIQLS
ncbi:hypothetical protein HY632_02545 [Candidatus Uhrbacteria bacterium]|nr:hypothetical protein [Candidatus Uhrbacteria bacterium]